MTHRTPLHNRFSVDDILANVETQQTLYEGESVNFEQAIDRGAYENGVDTNSVEDLAQLFSLVESRAKAARTLQSWIRDRIGTLLGPDRVYRYGNTVHRYTRTGHWKPVGDDPRPLVAFAVEAGDPADVVAIFNLSKPKITGIRQVATRRGLDPEETARRFVEYSFGPASGNTITPAAKSGWRNWYPTGEGFATKPSAKSEEDK